jgi:hypothetical protein
MSLYTFDMLEIPSRPAMAFNTGGLFMGFYSKTCLR